jgi:hypothetical protein
MRTKILSKPEGEEYLVDCFFWEFIFGKSAIQGLGPSPFPRQFAVVNLMM